MAAVHPPAPNCDDRAHQPPPGIAGNCSSIASVPPSAHWNRKNCAMPGSVYHGGQHDICGVCDNNNQMAPWIGVPGVGGGAHGQIVAVEPWRQASAIRWPRAAGRRLGDHLIWTAFLTRLCRTCEEVEQSKCFFYLNNPGHPITIAAQPPNMVQMGNWPSDRCTCAYDINGQIGPLPGVGAAAAHPVRYCRRDHLDVWLNLIAMRNANDDWLFNTSRDSEGRLCMASHKTKKARASVKSSSYRDCRCGATIDLNGLMPEVVLCMACQGLVHVTLPGTPGARSQPPFRFENKRWNQKHRRAQGPLHLHRPRAAHDDRQ